jgi:hypothetical protein
LASASVCCTQFGGQLGDRLLPLQFGRGRGLVLGIDLGLCGIAGDAEVGGAAGGDHPGRRGLPRLWRGRIDRLRRRAWIGLGQRAGEFCDGRAARSLWPPPLLLAWARKSALSGACWFATLTRVTSSVGRLGLGFTK